VRPPEEYLSLVESGRLPIGGEEHLTSQEEDLEEVFHKLRTLEGIPIGSVASDVALGSWSRDCSAWWTTNSYRPSEGCSS
jgi:coproporphyrinogen III oxidase-like Fe-S oxidoreductase